MDDGGSNRALRPKQVRKMVLCTNDAHGLYEQYGFHIIEKPEIYMERIK